MFNIVSHQENGNQNNTETQCHLIQTGHHQENKQEMLERLGKGKHLQTAAGAVNWYSHYGNKCGGCLEY